MNAMPIDAEIHRRATPNERQPGRETADAANRAAHEHECAASQLDVKQTRAARHAAEIAKQAGREQDWTARDAREAWDERIRSMLAATKSAPRWPPELSYLNSVPAIPDPTLERLGQVDTAPIEPADFMTVQARELQRLASLGDNGDLRAQAFVGPVELPALAPHTLPQTERTTLGANARGYGEPEQEIFAQARFDALLRSRAQGQTIGHEYPKPIGQITDLIPPGTDQAASLAGYLDTANSQLPGTERLAKLQSPSPDHVARVFPDVSRRVYSAHIAQSISGAAASLQSPSLDHIAQVSPGISNGDVLAPIAQSTLGSVAAPTPDPETAQWLERAVRASAPEITRNRTFQLGMSRDSDKPAFGERPVESDGRFRFHSQELSGQIRNKYGALTQRAILEHTTATAIGMPVGAAAGGESASLLERQRLLGISEPTRATMDATQGPPIDMDRLARAMEMFIQGLERILGTGQLPALGPGRSRTAPVPPALPAKPAPFAGRTDGSGNLS